MKIKIIFALLITLITLPLIGSSFNREIEFSRSGIDKNFSQKLVEGEVVDINYKDIAIKFHVNEDMTGDESFVISLNNKRILNGKQLQNPNEFISKIGKSEFCLNRIKFKSGENNLKFEYLGFSGAILTYNWTFNVLTLEMDSYKLIEDNFAKSNYKKNYLEISPNSKLLAYYQTGELHNSVVVNNLESNEEFSVLEVDATINELNINNKEHFAFKPVWSNDSSLLYFISLKSGSPEIWRSEISPNGESSNLLQLTSFGVHDISISPQNSLIYISEENSSIYEVKNIDKVKSKTDFKQNSHKIIGGNEFLFSSSLSFDGKYIAFCKKNNSKISLDIISLNGDLIHTIENSSKDILYPTWSPESNKLAYYNGKNLEIFDLDSKKSKIISEYVYVGENNNSPRWDLSGKSIYYVSNNKMLKTQIENLNTKNLVSTQNINNIKEIETSDNFKTLIFSYDKNSSKLGKLQQTTFKENSNISFIENYKNRIKLYSYKNKKYELLGYSPKIESKNYSVSLEKTEIPVNAYKFQINKETGSVKTKNLKPSTVKTDTKFEIDSLKGKVLGSAFLPGYANRKQNFKLKSNFSLISSIGFISLGVTSALISNKKYDDYSEDTNLEDLYNNRNAATKYSSLSKGLIFTGSLYYFYNILDSYFLDTNADNNDLNRHYATFYEKKNINGGFSTKKETTGNISNNKIDGKIKIAVKQPNSEISIYKDGKKEKIAKNYLVNDKDTYLTISSLKPGQYTLEVEKDLMTTEKRKISVKKGKTNYELFDLKSSKFKKFATYSVPGLMQFKRGEKEKGTTIASVATASLISGLYFYMQTNSYKKDYDNATNQIDLFEAKENQIKSKSYRDTAFLIFGLNYLYNIFDAYTGENI